MLMPPTNCCRPANKAASPLAAITVWVTLLGGQFPLSRPSKLLIRGTGSWRVGETSPHAAIKLGEG
jgi:hypothetical protein